MPPKVSLVVNGFIKEEAELFKELYDVVLKPLLNRDYEELVEITIEIINNKKKWVSYKFKDGTEGSFGWLLAEELYKALSILFV